MALSSSQAVSFCSNLVPSRPAGAAVACAASRIGISRDRYRDVVVSGKSRLIEEEIQRIVAVTGISEDRIRTWAQKPCGDTRNPAAR